MYLELPILFFAGFFGGVLNSIAGGGTFITFPALIFVGLPPIIANATNTFASCFGYLSGTYAFRRDLVAHKSEILKLIFIGIIGGTVGAWLLLQTSEHDFQNVIPWLLTFATIIFITGNYINIKIRDFAKKHKIASHVGTIATIVLLFGICIYGGFFNAGLGIIALSYLALAGYQNLNTMNGLKLLLSVCVSIAAIILFAFNDSIAWAQGLAVLLGTLSGGYLAARISRYLPQNYIKTFITLIATLVTTFFFYEVYFLKSQNT
ncbi:MAG: sulfite exporter TauE/SafE family protein [Rhodospirillales bacterium]|tara:strand:- start:2851 stop:3639 length:789 start_codon:yes stop_codon:yes gene_type:complete